MERKSKQVIVMRTDLRNAKGEKVRTGKLIAQGAHASLKALLDRGSLSPNEGGGDDFFLDLPRDSGLSDWIFGKFTKVCVKVDSEEELLSLYNKAKASGIPCSLILDAGLTEFDKPTHTCIAVGPAWSDEVDAITNGLSLL